MNVPTLQVIDVVHPLKHDRRSRAFTSTQKAAEHLCKHLLGDEEHEFWIDLCPELMDIADIEDQDRRTEIRGRPTAHPEAFNRLYGTYVELLSRSIENAKANRLVAVSKVREVAFKSEKVRRGGLFLWVDELADTVVTASLVGIICVFSKYGDRLVTGYCFMGDSHGEVDLGGDRSMARWVTRRQRDQQRSELRREHLTSARRVYERSYLRMFKAARRWQHLSRTMQGFFLDDRAVLWPPLKELGKLTFEEWKVAVQNGGRWIFE